MGQRTLYTIGHSNRAWGEFVELLRGWEIEQLVDVRTVPRSRAVPWAWDKKMAVKLPEAGIGYVHLGALGGLRRAGKDSVNGGWENASFRGYADYMQTKEFEEGLRELNGAEDAADLCDVLGGGLVAVSSADDCGCGGGAGDSGEAHHERDGGEGARDDGVCGGEEEGAEGGDYLSGVIGAILQGIRGGCFGRLPSRRFAPGLGGG